jgi:hypothetical protein
MPLKRSPPEEPVPRVPTDNAQRGIASVAAAVVGVVAAVALEAPREWPPRRAGERLRQRTGPKSPRPLHLRRHLRPAVAGLVRRANFTPPQPGGLCLLVLALCLSGCREKKVLLYVEKVEIDAELERTRVSMKQDEVRKLFEQVLARTQGVVMLEPDQKPPEDAAPGRIRAELFVEGPPPPAPSESGAEPTDTPDAEVLAGNVRLQLRQADGVSRLEMEASVPLPREGGAVEARKSLEQLLGSLAGSAALSRVALARKDEALVKDLSAPSGQVREAAARVLVERHQSAVIPYLEETLKSENPMVVRRAIGALVELKARTAVPGLIDLARGRDLGFLREVVFALGSIGGEEAEAYLFTVSQGHDQPLIREAADEALSELRTSRTTRREGASP